MIKNHNYTITKVAMNVGISETTLYEYLKNNLSPSLPVLINLANFFNCNIDYIIGRTNNPALYDNYRSDEVNYIIYMLDYLTKEETKLVNTLIKSIINEKEKAKN